MRQNLSFRPASCRACDHLTARLRLNSSKTAFIVGESSWDIRYKMLNTCLNLSSCLGQSESHFLTVFSRWKTDEMHSLTFRNVILCVCECDYVCVMVDKCWSEGKFIEWVSPLFPCVVRSEFGLSDLYGKHFNLRSHRPGLHVIHLWRKISRVIFTVICGFCKQRSKG